MDNVANRMLSHYRAPFLLEYIATMQYRIIWRIMGFYGFPVEGIGVDHVDANTPWKACELVAVKHKLPVKHTFFTPVLMD